MTCRTLLLAGRWNEEKAAQDGENLRMLGYESYEDGDEKDSGYGDD